MNPSDLALADLMTLCASRLREYAYNLPHEEWPALSSVALRANADHIDMWAREIRRRMKGVRSHD